MGKSLDGRKRSLFNIDFVGKFVYEPGELKVISVFGRGKNGLLDSIKTAGNPAALRLKADPGGNCRRRT